MTQNPSKYNDVNYPIEPIWALKSTFILLIILPIAMTILSFLLWSEFSSTAEVTKHSYRGLLYLGIYILIIPVTFFTNVIRRATFHYQFDDKFLNLKQGLIRRQNRQLPYGVIQNVIVTRGILDRLFGLSTITIQNATQSTMKDIKSQNSEVAGFFGNTIKIPGLSKENGEEVKNGLLKKIQASPTVELGM